MNKASFKKLILAPLAFVTLVVIFFSCEKTGIDRKSNPVSIYLTDHPGQYKKVLVDITKVEVKIDTSNHQSDDNFGSQQGHMDHNDDDHQRQADEFGYWKTLDIKPGKYNILALRNGIDTLLATGTIDGKIRKVRISINSVTVVKDSIEIPVILIPGLKNFLYANIHDRHMETTENHKKLWIDFDISRSIIEYNGQLFLNPILKPFCDRNFAQIEGVVVPAEAQPFVTAISATDTATAIPMSDGRFKIRGLEEGIYTLYFKGSNGYLDTAISNILVTKGRETRLAKVTLKK